MFTAVTGKSVTALKMSLSMSDLTLKVQADVLISGLICLQTPLLVLKSGNEYTRAFHHLIYLGTGAPQGQEEAWDTGKRLTYSLLGLPLLSTTTTGQHSSVYSPCLQLQLLLRIPGYPHHIHISHNCTHHLITFMLMSH